MVSAPLAIPATHECGPPSPRSPRESGEPLPALGSMIPALAPAAASVLSSPHPSTPFRVPPTEPPASVSSLQSSPLQPPPLQSQTSQSGGGVSAVSIQVERCPLLASVQPVRHIFGKI